MKHAAILLTLLAMLLHGNAAAWTGPNPPAPPGQPASGPGGRDAPFAEVRMRRHGEPPTGYSLFLPESPRAGAPESALPLVIFLHGFTAVEPDSYRDWLEHIARRGAVVVYPDYQSADPFETPWAQMLPNAISAVQDAVSRLDAERPGLVDVTRTLVVGHSLGGVLAMNLAAVADGKRIPTPLALMVIQPGGCAGCDPVPPDSGIQIGSLLEIDPDTLLLMVVGQDDGVVGDVAARILWQAVPQIPLERRDYLTFTTDSRGGTRLEADHNLPQTSFPGDPTNAYDWRGTWKLFDLLSECAIHDAGCDRAIGNTAVQRDMGTWSDGTPVAQPLITSEPLPAEPTR